MSLLTLLLAKPTDIVTIGAPLFVAQALPLYFCSITGQHLLQELSRTPTIEQQVVVRPDHLRTHLVEPHQSQTHQGSLTHMKALNAVGLQQRLQLSLLRRRWLTAPIQDAYGHLHTAQNDLQGFCRRLPQEGRAQDAMSCDHLLPRSLKGIYR